MLLVGKPKILVENVLLVGKPENWEKMRYW